MKRKRPLLYEVLGDENRREPGAEPREVKAPPAAKVPRAARPRGTKEIRLSIEFALVVGGVILVSLATTYYLGRLHGEAGAARPKLSTVAGSLGEPGWGDRAPNPTPPEPRAVVPGYAVQVLTRKWSPITGKLAVKEDVSKVLTFLSAQPGCESAWAYEKEQAREMTVYAAWSADRSSLDRTVMQVRQLRYENRLDFNKAFVTRMNRPPNIE